MKNAEGSQGFRDIGRYKENESIDRKNKRNKKEKNKDQKNKNKDHINNKRAEENDEQQQCS